MSLFDFTAKPTDAASLARNRVSKVLGKKRPSDADAAAPAALGSGSTIARLLREKAEDEQREKKVARQTETLRDMERSDEATAPPPAASRRGSPRSQDRRQGGRG